MDFQSIGYAYASGQGSELSANQKRVASAYVNELYDYLIRIGWSFYFDCGEPVSFEDFRDNAAATKTIPISMDNNEAQWCEDPLDNLKFRFVHDWIHVNYDQDFSMGGEFGAYAIMVEVFPCSDVLKDLWFSEVVGQAAYYYTFGDFPKVQKVVLNLR